MSRHSDADPPRVQDDMTEKGLSDRALLDKVLAGDPEENDPPQEEFSKDGLPHPAGRRRARRWMAVLVVLIVVLSAGVVGVEYLVRGQVDSTVRSALPGLNPGTQTATRKIVLSQAVGGSLDSLSVDSPSLAVTSKGQSNAPITLSDVDVDLNHVSLHRPYQTDTVTASGTTSWRQVTTLAATPHPRPKGVTLQAKHTGAGARDPGGIQASISVLGLSGEAEITPSLDADGSLILTTTSTRMGGNTLGIDAGTRQNSILSYVGLDSPQIMIPAKSLLSGLRPISAIVTNNGLQLGLAGSRANLGQL